MDKIAFLSVAVHDQRYLDQQKRLLDSIKEFHPESGIFFWTNNYPAGSKSMGESMYGFKVHAVKRAMEHGYTKIIWIDTACILVDRLDPYFELVKQYGVVAAEDDNLLANYCGDECYQYFGVDREDSRGQKQHLVGGSIFVFDFDLPLCNDIFTKWGEAENQGIFGTWKTPAHRHDESCMSLALYQSGSRPTPYPDAYYNDVPNHLIIKKHFK